MISTLKEAWEWYQSVQALTQVMARLGSKYWDHLPWEGPLGRDDHLRELGTSEILERSATIIDDLDDLCVLMLFCVFEAIVRRQTLEDVEREIQSPRHPTLQQLVKEWHDTIEQGSFARVLEAYKVSDANLVEEVNQVRRYRNWVAHGRRGKPRDNVSPLVADQRLEKFLDELMNQTKLSS